MPPFSFGQPNLDTASVHLASTMLTLDRPTGSVA